LEKTLQKKLYRVLEEICAASADDCKRFVSSHESELAKLLLECVVSASPPSVAVSLCCAFICCCGVENYVPLTSVSTVK